MGTKQKKSTRNYVKNKLSKDLEARNKRKKIKAKMAAKEPAKNAPAPVPLPKVSKPGIESGSSAVDSFLEDGFFREMEKESDVESMGHSDLEDTPQPPKKKDKVSTKSELSAHKEQLEALKTKDAEFFEFLKENEPGLLDFEDDDDDDDDDEAAAAAGDEDEFAEQGEEDAVPAMTVSDIDGWHTTATTEFTFNSIRKLIRAFESGCHLDDEGAAKDGYQITSGAVFQRVMACCVTDMHDIFNGFLGITGEVTSAAMLTKSPKWKKLLPLAKAYTRNLLVLVEQITDAQMVHALVRHAERLIFYINAIPKMSSKYLKAVLRLFGSHEETRVSCYLLVRRMAVALPFPFIESCYKGLYLTFRRHAKFTSANTRPSIGFMQQCVVELYGLDPSVAYEHAFVYIRQLAIQLRNALINKTKENMQVVSGWVFINSLQLWSKFLGTHIDLGQTKMLVFPFIQIVSGVIRLLSSPRYYPLRFLCVRMLIGVASKASVFVPVAPLLLEVLQCSDFNKRGKQSAGKAPDFAITLKVPKKLSTSGAYQDAAFAQCIDLLRQYFSVYAASIAFPELCYHARVALQKFKNDTQHARWRKDVKDLIDLLDKNSEFIKTKRNATELSPKDVRDLSSWLDEKARKQCPMSAPLNLELPPSVTSSDREADKEKAIASKTKKKDTKKKKRVQESESSEEEAGESHDDEDDAPAPPPKKAKKTPKASNGEDVVAPLSRGFDFDDSDSD